MRGGFDFGDMLLDVGKDVLKNAYKEGKEFIKSDEFKKLFNKPISGGDDGQMNEAEWACREGYGDCRDAGVLYPMPEWRGGDTFRSDLEKIMGGTYKDDGEEKTLRRWFKAKGSGIMANSQFYRTDPKRGGALKEDIQQAGSATTNETVKEIQETPMGNEDISKYFPDARYIKYSELKNYQSITDLLPKNGSFFFLLYEHKPNVGHWVLLTRYDNKIENFDSYGLEPSKPLSWNRPETNQQLGQDKPYLSALLRDSELPVIVNRTQFQGKTNHSSTCGAWDVLRQLSIKDGNSSLPEFTSKINEYKKKYGLSGDEIVSNLISKR